MKKKLPLSLALCMAISSPIITQAGVYVASGSEFGNYGTIDLAIAAGQTWATARTATPGYFTAYGSANFINAMDGTNQLIDGYCKHTSSTVNQGFVFPIGINTDLRTLEISGSRNATSTIATAWIAGNPSITGDITNTNALHSTTALSGSITAVSDAGQWDWQDITNNAEGVTVTVSIPDVTSLTGGADSLRLVGWSHASNSWVALGTTGAASKTKGALLSGIMIADIDAIGIGMMGGSTLPAQIASFNANKYQNKASKLDWTTIAESNSKGFEIQRSADGNAWSVIGFVNTQAPEGNSNNTLSYAYFDYAPLSGDNFYRFKMIHNNDEYAYSKIGKVAFENTIKDAIVVFPNPGSANNPNINLMLTTTYEGKAEVVIVNALGQYILNQTVTVNKGTNRFAITNHSLTAGKYYVQIKGNNGTIGTTAQLIMQ